MKILITGATGFLGSNLVKRLIGKDHQIVALKRSFSNNFRLEGYIKHIKFYDIDIIDVEQVFEENVFNLVIHCATDYGRREALPLKIIEANLILPLRLFQYAVYHGIDAFINTDTILDKRVNSYSLSKKQFLDWLSIYSDNLKVFNIAIEHFYGPVDNKTKFISKLIDDLLRGVESVDLTMGEQKRDFIFIDDVIEGFLLIIDNIDKFGKGMHFFEIGSGESVSIKEVALLIKKLCNNERTYLDFGAVPYRENEIMESKVNIELLKELGWMPKVKLEDGLRATIDLERNR